MKDDILLSIIVPAYNVELFIVGTLDMIFSQLTRQTELIIIDDGSTDGTYKVIEEYITNFLQHKHYDGINDNIILLHQNNGGCSKARNYGLRVCRGKYITFIDSDDAIKPGYLNEFLMYIDKYKYFDVCITGVETYSEDGKLYESICNKNEILSSHKEVVNAIITGEAKIVFPMWSKIVRKDLLKQHNIVFDDDAVCMSDGLFFTKIYRYVNKMILSDYVGYEWRRRPGSISTNYYDATSELASRFVDRCQKMLDSVPDIYNSKDAERWLLYIKKERFEYIIGKIQASNLLDKEKREKVLEALQRNLAYDVINEAYGKFESKLLFLAKKNNLYAYYRVLKGIKWCHKCCDRIVTAIERRIVRR